MADARHVIVTDTAMRQAKHLGVGGNVKSRLERMARRAAVITHPQGNRRFGDYLLRIKDGQLEAIMKFDPETRTVHG
ncbi:hypothetical protein EVC30_140 [Rhizobium phage RHph_Y1_11]|nr:hypothetical protein EVC30_140 [Rhizobium phage RHph_Y1_11]